jgi:hypothetical protein
MREKSFLEIFCDVLSDLILHVAGVVFVLLLCIFIALMLAGCALGNRQSADIHVGHVGGDLWVRSIADGAQMSSGESTSIDLSTDGVPASGIPPIGLGVLGSGMGRSTKVMIDSVSGSFFVDSALHGAQGVPIPEALGKLFKPGDPFAITEK